MAANPYANPNRTTPECMRNGVLRSTGRLEYAGQGARHHFPQYRDPGHERHAFHAVQREVFYAHSRSGMDQLFEAANRHFIQAAANILEPFGSVAAIGIEIADVEHGSLGKPQVQPGQFGSAVEMRSVGGIPGLGEGDEQFLPGEGAHASQFLTRVAEVFHGTQTEDYVIFLIASGLGEGNATHPGADREITAMGEPNVIDVDSMHVPGAGPAHGHGLPAWAATV